MLRSAPLLPTLLALAGAVGCTPQIVRDDHPSLPLRGGLETVGGALLALDPDGTLVIRPASGDLDGALGATLEDADGGVRVAGRLSADSPLQVGDVILRAEPRAPNEEPWPGVTDQLQSPHPVTRRSDLAGYALGWTDLLLEVRRGDETLLLECEVGRPQPVAARQWCPNSTKSIGFLGVRADALPPGLRPKLAAAKEDVLVVTWVDASSLVAQQGLRPLSLVAGIPAELTTRGHTYPTLPPGAERWREVRLSNEGGEDWDLLNVVAYRSDANESAVRVGPLFAAGGAVQRLQYNPRTDRYRDGSLTILGASNLITVGHEDGDGRGSDTTVLVGPILLGPRLLNAFGDGPEETLFDWDGEGE